MTDNHAWRAPAFNRIRGNAKNFYDDEVGPLTFFLGSNQSGKSGRIIGIRYGLGGTQGWSLGVHGSDIVRLSADPEAGYFSELISPAGKALFEVNVEDGKPREPEKTPRFTDDLDRNIPKEDRDRILPLVSMSDLLKLGPDLGRRALIQRFGDVKQIKQPTALLPEQKKLWNEVLAEVTKELTKKTREGQVIEPDPTQVLVGMSKAFNKRKLAIGKTVSALEEDLKSRQNALAEEAAGAEQVPALKQQLIVAKAWESAAHFRNRLATLEVEKQRYRDQAAPYQASEQPEVKAKREAEVAAARGVIEAKIAAVTAALEELNKDLAGQMEKLAWGQNLLAAIRRCLEHPTPEGKTPCPLCKNVEFDAAESEKFIAPAVEQRRSSIALVDAKIAERTRDLASARNELLEFDRQRDAAHRQDEQARKRLQQEHARIVAAEQEIKAGIAALNSPATYGGPTAVQLQATIEALENAEEAKRKLELDTENLRKKKLERELAKELETESKKLLDEFVRKVKNTAETTINQYMPDRMAAVVDLDDNSWAVIDKHGRARDKHLMCGFEKDSLVPALAIGYTEPSPLRVLTLDDEDLAGVGTENAERFFGALARAVAAGHLTQVFCAGNRFEHLVPMLQAQGWRIIRTDEPQPQPQVQEQTSSHLSVVPDLEPPATNGSNPETLYLDGGILKL